MFRSLVDFKEERKLVDVLIEPQTDDLSVFEFKNVDSLFQRGYKAALPYKEYFKKLADSLNRIDPQKPLENILNKQSYKFDKIEINGNKSYSDLQILGVLDIHPFEKVDKYLLTDRIELLYGKAWFDKVKYSVVSRNDSLVLAIDCTEKPQAMLYGSVHYDNSLKSGLILGMSVKNLLTQRSDINLNSFIGEYFRFEANSIQFIDRNQKFGLSANFYADNTLLPMLELRGDNGDVISRNFTPGLSITNRIGLNNMMSISTDYENLNLILHYISDAHLKSLSYNYITSTFRYQLNSVDSKNFPERGIRLNLSASTSRLISAGIRTDSSKVVFRGNDNSDFSFARFFTIYGNYEQYFSNDRRLTFAIGGKILYITDSDSVSAQNNFYLLGGIESVNNRSIPIIGFHTNEIPIKKMAAINTELDIKLSENLHFNIMAGITAAQEVNRNNGFTVLSGYGLGMGYMSIIGPLKIGLMQGNSKDERFFKRTKGYLNIGYNF
jgi:NTE family protein